MEIRSAVGNTIGFVQNWVWRPVVKPFIWKPIVVPMFKVGLAFGIGYAGYTAIETPPANVRSAIHDGTGGGGLIEQGKVLAFDAINQAFPHSSIVGILKSLTTVTVVVPAKIGAGLSGGATGGVVQLGKNFVIWACDDLTSSLPHLPGRPEQVANEASSASRHALGG